MNLQPISGFPGYYAGDDGEIYSFRAHGGYRGNGARRPTVPRRLWANPDRNGSLMVGLWIDGKPSTRFVGGLVCAAFYGPRPKGMQVRYADGDKKNTRPENLTWGPTSRERYRNMPIYRGEENARHRLTVDQVRYARTECRAGRKTQAAVAVELGISHGTISKIVSGEAWAWLSDITERAA